MRELQIDGQVIALLPDNVAEALKRALVQPAAFLNASIQPYPPVRHIDVAQDYGASMEIRSPHDRVELAHVSIVVEVPMDMRTMMHAGIALLKAS